MATVDSTKLTCSIDFDDEWIQEDCHWSYDRIFTFTYEILDSSLANKQFYYRLSESDSYTPIAELKNIGNTYYYTLRLSSVSQSTLIDKRTSEGWLKVGIRVSAGIYEATAEYEYLLELPPEPIPIENLKTELVVSKPGEVLCSWTSAYVHEPDDLHGYCIEIECNGTKLNGLSWDLTSDNYRLTRNEVETPDIRIPEGAELTLVGQGDSSEAYITDLTVVGFYFSPKELGIKPGDSYTITIYPYTVYGTCSVCDDIGNITGFVPGTLLTNEGTSLTNKTSKGIVRVKTKSGWVEGQVYVMVDDGTGKGIWKEADSVYVNTENGWRESI